jgi:hypothetical protein
MRQEFGSTVQDAGISPAFKTETTRMARMLAMVAVVGWCGCGGGVEEDTRAAKAQQRLDDCIEACPNPRGDKSEWITCVGECDDEKRRESAGVQ